MAGSSSSSFSSSTSSSETAHLISSQPCIQSTNQIKELLHDSNSYDTFSKPSAAATGNSQEDAADIKVVSSGQHHIAYTRRWYILMLYSLTAFLQAAAWNTWGPIADTAKPVLGWTDADIALLTNMGCITYLLSAFFFAWLMDKKGLRVALLILSSLLVIGLAVRCIPIRVEYAKWTMNLGGLFIGFAGPISAAPPLLSATWFPQQQRTTSTAIYASSVYLGVAGSFLIGPLLVTGISNTNQTSIIPSSVGNDSYMYTSESEEIDPHVLTEHLREINLLLYIECAFGVFLCLMAWAYLPARPPTPPSASANIKRTDFITGATTLIRSSQFWIPALAFSMSVGVNNVWATQLDTIFQHLVDVGQGTAGWVGFYSNLAGATGSLIFARFVDCLGGKMKRMLLVITIAAVLCFTVLVLLLLEVIPFNIVCLYFSCITFSFLLNGTVPIYYEVIVEGVYPVAEGITTGVLTWLNNVVGLTFLLVLMIPNIGIAWMNWTMLLSVILCIPCLLFYKERYNRLNLDTLSDSIDGTIQQNGHPG